MSFAAVTALGESTRGRIRRGGRRRTRRRQARRHRHHRLYVRHDRHAERRDAQPSQHAAHLGSQVVERPRSQRVELTRYSVICRSVTSPSGASRRSCNCSPVAWSASPKSVDTVVINLREIAPQGFLGVPRIWEKMQQSVDYRIRRHDTVPAPGLRGLHEARHDRSPSADSPMAARWPICATASLSPLLWLVCFGSLQRFLGLNQVRAASAAAPRCRRRCCCSSGFSACRSIRSTA